MRSLSCAKVSSGDQGCGVVGVSLDSGEVPGRMSRIWEK